MVNRPTLKEIIIGVIGLVILILGVVTVVNFYKSESTPQVSTFSADSEKIADRVDVSVKLISIDPIKGDLTARLNFEPKGAFLKEDGTLAQDLLLDQNGSVGKVEVSFKKGERMNPTDVTVSLYDGVVMDYPFDKHSAELAISFSAPEKNKDTGEVTYGEVPILVDYTGALAGFNLQAAEDTTDKIVGYSLINFSVQRSNSVIAFAVLIMVMQWLLALIAILAVWVWVVRGMKMEVTMFGWMGALLFALIPLRNAMPAIPPVGTLSDYLSFFWVEAIITLCLVISICAWAFNRARPS